MEVNALKEIYLTHLLEQHKKYHVAVGEQVSNIEANSSKAFNFPCSTNQLPFKTISQGPNQYSYGKFQTTSTKVHVNPNFNPVNTTIHINPKLRGKTSIYVNPKVIKNIAAKQQIESSKDSKQDSNPNIVETKYERSVHVNPKLMQKLSSTVPTQSKSHNEKVIKPVSQYAVCSKSKLIKSIVVSPVTPRRSLGSNLVSVSKRKLIRMKSNVKGSSGMALNSKHKRIVNSGIRKTKVATKYKLVMDIEKKSASTTTVTKPIGTTTKIQPNKYKIDRTAAQGIGESKIVKVPSLRKLEGCTTALLRIGGVLYKSSRNQLIRSNIHTPSSKKKRYVINIQGDKFLMASDGKKLCRLNSVGESSPVINKSRISIGGITYVEKTPNVLVRATSKTIISNKVKQRSIQILRNKMRKNNQPCLFFQRFGYCANQVKSTCHKLHDKKQVALCKNFLQGKCLLDDCRMSHDVGPEKMPTCKYFLEGCCIRDLCPYLHVKVSANTPICTQFLRGYCAEANKCKKRHVYLCPEFERTGTCGKGKYCPYPHKKNVSTSKRPRKLPDRKNKAISSDIASTVPSHTKSSKRYYDESGNASIDIEKMRESVLKKVKIMKSTKIVQAKKGKDSGEQNDVSSRTSEDKSYSEYERPQRAPLGPLPAYIPIN